ncbi:MAG: Rieske (2Fe-2S) protein [Anaerolineales bacterium]|jgi:cytochrome b6-f complex iron-sulfur subunit|nr:Rieske (2Fe-2S) protein [Anaerolineales bacterium]
MSSLSRRDFLCLASRGLLGLSGLLGLAGLLRFLSFSPQPGPPPSYEIGPASEFPPNSRTVVAAIPALIVHEQGKFHAIEMICTHLGCAVEAQPDGFVCPCHGSCYNSSGEVTHGPAQSALPSLRIEQTPAGRLIVYKN